MVLSVWPFLRIQIALSDSVFQPLKSFHDCQMHTVLTFTNHAADGIAYLLSMTASYKNVTKRKSFKSTNCFEWWTTFWNHSCQFSNLPIHIAAYLYVTTRKKSTDLEDDKVAVEEQTPAPIVNAAAIVPEKTPPTALEKTTPVLPTAEPLKIQQPIPADEQRELFKWILAEKRKVVPENPSEKKRIDEEKAILKQYIRAESIRVLWESHPKSQFDGLDILMFVNCLMLVCCCIVFCLWNAIQLLTSYLIGRLSVPNETEELSDTSSKLGFPPWALKELNSYNKLTTKNKITSSSALSYCALTTLHSFEVYTQGR